MPEWVVGPGRRCLRGAVGLRWHLFALHKFWDFLKLAEGRVGCDVQREVAVRLMHAGRGVLLPARSRAPLGVSHACPMGSRGHA